ncbi:MAG: twin-arginine translocase subunit TatA [Gammaproteobacteria bacterium]|nr:MAG: twin-arginine translocase subunit TatA [Gammaproteobacteria bacterium]
MGMPSIPQLIIILVIVVVIFGAKRLRNVGSDLGTAVKGFKDAVKDESKAGEGESARIEDGKDSVDVHKAEENKSV